MSINPSTNYIKKLVKIVYEKEKVIEHMKKTLRQKNCNVLSQNSNTDLHPDIKQELNFAATQLQEVNRQMQGLERKISHLQQGLEEQISKNYKLAQDNEILTQKNDEAKEEIKRLSATAAEQAEVIQQLALQMETKEKQQIELNELTLKIGEKLTLMKTQQEKQKLNHMQQQTALAELKIQISKKNQEAKTKQAELQSIKSEMSGLHLKVGSLQKEGKILRQQNQKFKEHFLKLTTQYNSLKAEHEQIKEQLATKESQYILINETLKDYEQFALEMHQYIEATFVKYCSPNKLRSSKKLIGCSEGRFQSDICKMNHIQQWMDRAQDKIEKMIQQNQLPTGTLQNLSIIAHSFEQKLELCDLTERLEKEKQEELDKNEEELLEHLQKQCQKSMMRERSKLVELDEARQILKVTKEINRELMDQINSKQFLISECKKACASLLVGKNGPECTALKKLLNLKQ